MPPGARDLQANGRTSPGGGARSPRSRSRSALGSSCPELTSSSRTVVYEIVGVGYAILGIAFIAYGFRRQQLLERALLEGRFVPFSTGAALFFTLGGGLLGLATLVIIVL